MPFHTSAAEHYEKLRRVHARLDNGVHKDDLDDFFKTAHHLIENIDKDPATDAVQRAQARALRADPDIELCREIANRQKHYTLKPRSHPNPQIRGSARVAQGWGVGRYGKGGWGKGEQSVTLELVDGTSRNALDLAGSVLAKFAAIFPST